MDRMPEKWPERIDEDKLKQIINQSPEAISAEFERTDNDWISCFASRVFILETNLFLSKADGFMNADDYEKYQLKIEIIKDKLAKARGKHRNQGKKLPPSDLMNDLIDSLDIFA